jgi:acyl-CoA thioester hydrolase
VPFIHHVQLRFSDYDAMGHVNNARPLTFIEDARLAFMTSLKTPVTGGVIVARTEVDYLRPIVPSREPLAVSVDVGDIGRSSFRLVSEIEQDGTVAARASVVMVAYDYGEARSRPLTDDERAGLEATRL